MAELGPLERLKSGKAPRNLRLALADGLVPLDDTELVVAFDILTNDPDQEVRDVLRENLGGMPRNFLNQTSRSHQTPGNFLDFLAKIFIEDQEILANIILNRNVQDHTMVALAEEGPVETLEMLAGNRNRMLTCPDILETLVANNRLPKVLFYALEEFKERFKDSFRTAESIESKKDSHDKQMEPELEDTPDHPTESVDASLEDDDDLEDTADLDFSTEFDELVGSEEDDLTEESDDEDDELQITEDDDAADGDVDEWDMDYLTGKTAGKAADKGESTTSNDEMDFMRSLNLSEFDLEEPDDPNSSTDADSEWDNLLKSEEFDDDDDDDDDEDDDADKKAKKEEIVDTRMRIMKMGASDKMMMAKMGTKQERAILVRDSNKKVAVAVVDGPKMSEFEVKLIASNRSISDDVLRAVNNHRVWGKLPDIRKELVMNPKTPIAISLRLINSLNDFDLKEVLKSKEIPYGVAANAKRLHSLREQRRQGRKPGGH